MILLVCGYEKFYFTVAGGGQDIGESLLETTYREMKEELNLSKSDLEYVGECKVPVVFYFRKPITRYGVEYIGSEKYYLGFRFVGDEKVIHANDGEVRSYKWVTVDELDKYLLFESQLEDTLEKIREIFPEVK